MTVCKVSLLLSSDDTWDGTSVRWYRMCPKVGSAWMETPRRAKGQNAHLILIFSRVKLAVRAIGAN